MFDLMRKVTLAGIGALTLTEERAAKLMEELVEQGKVSREEGEQMAREWAAKTEAARGEWEGRMREIAQEMFRKLDLVPRADLERLDAHVRALEQRIRELEHRDREREETVLST